MMWQSATNGDDDDDVDVPHPLPLTGPPQVPLQLNDGNRQTMHKSMQHIFATSFSTPQHAAFPTPLLPLPCLDKSQLCEVGGKKGRG